MPGTVEELDSDVVRDLLARASSAGGGSAGGEAAPSDARDEAVGHIPHPADTRRGSHRPVPGVADDGQATVRAALDRNPAGALFERFLEATLAWDAVRVHGIKRKALPDGARPWRRRSHRSQGARGTRGTPAPTVRMARLARPALRATRATPARLDRKVPRDLPDRGDQPTLWRRTRSRHSRCRVLT